MRRTEPCPSLLLEPFRPPSPSETMQQWILICGPGSPCFPVEAPLFALPWQGSQSREPGPLNATKPRPKPGPEPSQLQRRRQRVGVRYLTHRYRSNEKDHIPLGRAGPTAAGVSATTRAGADRLLSPRLARSRVPDEPRSCRAEGGGRGDEPDNDGDHEVLPLSAMPASLPQRYRAVPRQCQWQRDWFAGSNRLTA